MSFVENSSTCAIIGWVICLPEYRGKGVMRKLFTDVLKQKQRPGMVVALEAAQEAYTMYEKFGFQVYGYTNDYQGISKHLEIDEN
jgi:predicted acetyltransferase